MNLQPDDNLLKWYLLGAASPEEAGQIEQNLRDSEAWREELQLIEEDMIDDYARGALPKYERHLFEENYLDSPERRQKLAIAQAVLNYVHKYDLAEAKDEDKLPAGSDPEELQRSEPGSLRRDNRSNRWAWLVEPAWKPALIMVLLLAVGIGAWQLLQGELEVRRALSDLKEAYRSARPLEARLTALNYAPFSPQRGAERGGGKEDGKTYLAGEQAEMILLGEVRERPSAKAYHALGLVYLLKSEFDKAIDMFEEALKSDPNNSELQSDMGAALMEKANAVEVERLPGLAGKSETIRTDSLKYLTKALELKGSLPEARFNRALLFERLGLPQRAIEDWRKYLEGDQKSQWAEEAKRHLKELEERNKKVSTNKDDLYWSFLESWKTKDEENAWEALRHSFFRDGNYIANKLIDGFLASSGAGNRAAAGDKLEVLNYAGDLLKRKGGDSFIHNLAGFYGKAKKRDLPLLSEARKLAGEGYKFYTVSNTNQAMEAYKQAKLLFERSGDDNEALLMKFYLGLCYILNLKSAIDIERSRIVFTQVARVSQENSFHWLHSAAQAGLTNYYNLCNEYSKAEDSCQLQKKLSEKIGDENGLLRDLQHLAYLYLRFGRYNESLKMIREGLLVSSRISADASETATLYSIGGDDYNALGCYAAALTYTQEALRLVKEIKHTKAISRDYVHLGMTYARLENYDEAIRNIKYGLESGSEQPESVSFASLFLGQIYRKMRLYDESISAITQAEKFYSQRKTDALLYMIAKEKLLTHIASGDVETAREELQSVIDIFENNRDKILEESNRNSYFDLEQPIYDVAINFVFSQLKEPLQALRYSELSRARSLLDAVSIKGQLIESEGSAPDIKYPSKTEPFLPGEIQRFIPEKAQIVEYAFLEDKLIIWLISKTKLEGRAVEISSKELNEKLKLYLQRISSPPNDQNEQSDLLVLNDAGDLYDLLVRPVAGMLDKDKVTCIVPDKMLYLLPFESLFSRESGKYLLEDYSIIYASSANLFLKCSEQARQKASARPEELLSVGNPRFDHQRFPELPDLPYAANEAERIADYYQHHSVYVDDAAVKSAILQGLKNADIVHLALHYMPDPQYPMLSQIPLAAGSAGDKRAREDGEVLAAYEIYRLKMPRTRLIVLSGCQTGVETWFNGEGPVGLSRTFLAKGIPLTVASLWPIEDSRATSDLMIRFHKGRKSEGLSTVKSLQLAKLALLKGPEKKCRRPFYWAPFTVTGGYSEF